jgi:hypothetical protein
VRNARGLIFGHVDVEERRVFCGGNVCCVMVDVVSVMDDDGEWLCIYMYFLLADFKMSKPRKPRIGAQI